MFSQTFRLIKSSPQSLNLETTSVTFVHEENLYRVQLCTAQHLVFYRYIGIKNRNRHSKNAAYTLVVY